MADIKLLLVEDDENLAYMEKSCTRQIENKYSLRSFAFSLQIEANNLLYETRN